MQKTSQAAKILTLSKVKISDLEVIMEAARNLNPNQIFRLLQNYSLNDSDSPVSFLTLDLHFLICFLKDVR